METCRNGGLMHNQIMKKLNVKPLSQAHIKNLPNLQKNYQDLKKEHAIF